MKVSYKSDFGLIKDVTYINFVGKLQGVYCDYKAENLQCSNGSKL